MDHHPKLSHTAIGHTHFQETISGKAAFLHMAHGNRCFQSFSPAPPFPARGSPFSTNVT
jgi:hypothetical protein